LTLFVSVGLECSIQPDPGFYLFKMQIESEGWLAGWLTLMPARLKKQPVTPNTEE
jgi:hypothetical protein